MSIRAFIERALSPGLGCCYRCHRPWRHGIHSIGVEPHSTPYAEDKACFPLCEGCWSALTPFDRLPYYYALLNSWLVEYRRLGLDLYTLPSYDAIHAAVMKEETCAPSTAVAST